MLVRFVSRGCDVSDSFADRVDDSSAKAVTWTCSASNGQKRVYLAKFGTKIDFLGEMTILSHKTILLQTFRAIMEILLGFFSKVPKTSILGQNRQKRVLLPRFGQN